MTTKTITLSAAEIAVRRGIDLPKGGRFALRSKSSPFALCHFKGGGRIPILILGSKLSLDECKLCGGDKKAHHKDYCCHLVNFQWCRCRNFTPLLATVRGISVGKEKGMFDVEVEIYPKNTVLARLEFER